jgi:hypothetical protein
MVKTDKKDEKSKLPGLIFVSPSDLANMNQAIEKMNGLNSSDLGAKRAKLRRLIKEDIDSLNDFMETTEWKRINDLYEKIDEQFARKNASGDARRTEKGQILIDPTKIKERELAIARMEESEREAVDKRKEIIKAYYSDMDKKKVDITHYIRIPFDMFPKDTTPTEVIDWLDPIIDYED